MVRKKRIYSDTSIIDSKNISFLQNIFSLHGLKPYLYADDKIPYIDGDVVILDKNNDRLATISVQVKTLPLDILETPKCSIDLSYFDFAEKHLNPFVFIIVNVDNKIAYWKHIDENEILGISTSQKSKTFYFNKENRITEKNKDYIEHWKKSYIERRNKIDTYDEIVRKNEQLSQFMTNYQSIDSSTHSEYNIRIHEFLDTINYVYDYQLRDLKEFLYPNCWKFGFAYTAYTENVMDFTCFPIKHDYNQRQIIKMDKSEFRKLMFKHNITLWHMGNLIEKRKYKQLANEIIFDDINKCINYRLFEVSHKALAVEILFNLIGEFGECMGLSEKDEYEVKEIARGYYGYLPIWIDEAIKIDTVILNRNRDINPSTILFQLFTDKREAIRNKVSERIKLGDTTTGIYAITSHKIILRLIPMAFKYLQSISVKKISRPYPRPKYPKNKKKLWVWDGYSKESVKNKLEKIYADLADAYNSIVRQYFSQLFEKINFFAEYDKKIIHVQLNKPNGFGEPSYTTYNLKYEAGAPLDKYAEVYIDDEFPYKEDILRSSLKDNVSNNIEINGSQYSLISRSLSGGGHVYDDTPVLNLCYEILSNRLKTVLLK